VDPVVNPGGVAGHVHTVSGKQTAGSNTLIHVSNDVQVDQTLVLM